MYVAPNSREVAGYVKSHKNFSFYWILDAGHMVFCVICWLHLIHDTVVSYRVAVELAVVGLTDD